MQATYAHARLKSAEISNFRIDSISRANFSCHIFLASPNRENSPSLFLLRISCHIGAITPNSSALQSSYLPLSFPLGLGEAHPHQKLNKLQLACINQLSSPVHPIFSLFRILNHGFHFASSWASLFGHRRRPVPPTCRWETMTSFRSGVFRSTC